MKKLTSIIFLFSIIIFFLSCDDLLESGKNLVGSGNVIRIKRDIGEVDKFEFSNALEAFIVKGNQPGMSLLIDDNFEQYLMISESAEILEIGLEPNNSYRDYTFRVEIIVPEIREIEGSGAIYADIAGFESDGIVSISLSGASSLEGDLLAETLKLILSGASSVNLSGSCNKLNINASGASIIQLGDYESDTIEINLSGASIASIYSNGTISAELTGASILNYMGNADIISLRTSGASIVNHISKP